MVRTFKWKHTSTLMILYFIKIQWQEKVCETFGIVLFEVKDIDKHNESKIITPNSYLSCLYWTHSFNMQNGSGKSRWTLRINYWLTQSVLFCKLLACSNVFFSKQWLPSWCPAVDTRLVQCLMYCRLMNRDVSQFQWCLQIFGCH